MAVGEGEGLPAKGHENLFLEWWQCSNFDLGYGYTGVCLCQTHSTIHFTFVHSLHVNYIAIKSLFNYLYQISINKVLAQKWKSSYGLHLPLAWSTQEVLPFMRGTDNKSEVPLEMTALDLLF